MRQNFWQGRPWQAFKNFAVIFSFIMNLVLLVVLLIAAPLLIPIVDTIAKPIVAGLSDSFQEMGVARIEQVIIVDDTIPVQFNVPLSTTTTVTLDAPVPVAVPATFNLFGGSGTIHGTVLLDLPEGMELPINLQLIVPVSDTVPVNLAVAVDIPLADTDLGPPFTTLQELFGPLDDLLQQLPNTNEELLTRVTRSRTENGVPVTGLETVHPR